ncbi:hypothetical protein NliqN6_4593 [Naganishia liquefaciens]|uniref:Uncharacterized protein n=1 Tax=Naganishia liquefaciens TaxID=104408 RepID=A0A8H3TWI3_9TREE|nr:hypothetical protein NliqN6_4593 [Naganishia liquefaciens]
MFSSSLPYTRRTSHDRYTQPLPPPVPASPLRQPSHPEPHHAFSAPAVIPQHADPAATLTSPYGGPLVDSPGIDPTTEDAALSEAIRRSLSISSQQGGVWADMHALQDARDVEWSVGASGESGEKETEAERMVRMMSRRCRDRSRGRYSATTVPMGGFAPSQDPAQAPVGDPWNQGFRQDHSPYQESEQPTYQQNRESRHTESYQGPIYPQHEKYSWPAPLPPSLNTQDYPLHQHASSIPLAHHREHFAATTASPAPSKATYIPSLTPLDSALPSGAATPCPPYQLQPETAYLDAIPFEPSSGPSMRMPAAEDYASIPGYGACDSDEEEEEVNAIAQAGVGRSGTVVSRSSYTVGDEASLMRVSEAVPEPAILEELEQGMGAVQVEQSTEPVGPGPTAPEETAVRKIEDAVQEKRTLVFSYHPLPASAEPTPRIPAKSTLPPQIRLYLQPTSFQLLSTSLKRLLADLMISADSLFVPAPTAYAESEQERPEWHVDVWVRTFALPVPPERRVVGGGFRTMIGLEMDEIKPRPAPAGRASSSSLALTRTRSSVGERQEALSVQTLPRKPIATTTDHENALVPSFATSFVLRLRLIQPLHLPFSAAQLVETLHRHYKYGQRIARSSTTSVAAGTVEENAYSFAKMVDRAPGPIDEVARLSKAHKLGKIRGGAAAPLDDDADDGIQGQAGRKGFRYTVRKAVSKAVGAVQSEREETVEDDRANWVTPFTG